MEIELFSEHLLPDEIQFYFDFVSIEKGSNEISGGRRERNCEFKFIKTLSIDFKLIAYFRSCYVIR